MSYFLCDLNSKARPPTVNENSGSNCDPVIALSITETASPGDLTDPGKLRSHKPAP